MEMITKPMRRWGKSPDELNETALSKIEKGEIVEVPQGEDNPSKFLYKDMGGHLYWVRLQPYEILEKLND